MARLFRFGERLFLPALMQRASPDPSWPPERPLWVYVLDPASIGLRTPIARVRVPYEPLECGIRGELFEVDDRPLPDFLRKALDWPERLVIDFNEHPLDLDSPRYAIDGGVRPSTGEPRFAGQMVYAVCQRVYETFEHALGRDPVWGPWAQRRIREGVRPRLRLRPFACEEANAYYDDQAGTLEFGVCRAQSDTRSRFVLPGGLVLLALSHDVIAHELTHALLDGMRAHFMRDSNPDVLAFHEGFSDLVALFHHFNFRDLVEQGVEQDRGLNSEFLLGLARQFGEAVRGQEGRALRRAVEKMNELDPQGRPVLVLDGDAPSEPHDRGAVLVAAVFSAYLEVYKRRAEVLFRLARLSSGAGQAMPHELLTLLADEACSIATDFLHVCIRAIDFCPPTDIHFGEYLRAMISADRMLNPLDRKGIRDSLIKAFRLRNIGIEHVRDLSEYSLEWNGPASLEQRVPGLAWSDLRVANDGVTPRSVGEIERQATALAEYALRSDEMLAEFGLRRTGGDYDQIVVESIRSVALLAADGRHVHGIVAEITQRRRTNNGDFYGGATVLLDATGAVKFAVRKRVDDTEREEREQQFREASGRPELRGMRALHEWAMRRDEVGGADERVGRTS